MLNKPIKERIRFPADEDHSLVDIQDIRTGAVVKPKRKQSGELAGSVAATSETISRSISRPSSVECWCL